MREIEIKARVADSQMLFQKIKTNGITLGPELEQHDIVYGQPGVKDNQENSIWLRVRIQNKTKIFFTLKKSVRGHLDSIEHETVVEDSAETEAIIKLLGFEKHSDLTKIRRKAKVGNIELCVDMVNGLGEYIEAEMLVADDADHNQVEQKLWTLLSDLGISKNDEELRGYDVIERAQRGL
jgi:adenylate cyclase class 2